ncbi:hypothetical protein CVT24_010936 [Panaeolus cyanescens]|uniref:BTB domain-containing protein n=1 Tax=Panaeolus cyanescens TaxID=181874 RepID=A0A409YVS0_9AGAR|nr:hypothetical protein CVT24_010936 [Panaeolus cyanescens]
MTAFRIHRGVLARHSTVFNDMLSLPQPADADLFEGCPVVPMYDLPKDLSSLIHYLYDGFGTFEYKCIDDFFQLAGILRLASKYFIEPIRQQAVRILTNIWPATLLGHDQMIETALITPAVDNLTYPYAHPLHVLNLARELDISILIPMALYFLTIYPLSEIIAANHPKLITEHSSKPSNILSSKDIQLYTLMYQYRLQVLSSFIHDFCSQRIRKPACGNSTTCPKAFSGLVSQLHRSSNLKTNPLYEIRRTIDHVMCNHNLCSVCRTDFNTQAIKLRKSAWDDIPSIIGFPPWDQLRA